MQRAAGRRLPVSGNPAGRGCDPVYVAAPDDPRWCSCGMTRALEGELVAGVPPPELDMLASGALSPKCRVFLASKGDQAVSMLAASVSVA